MHLFVSAVRAAAGVASGTACAPARPRPLPAYIHPVLLHRAQQRKGGETAAPLPPAAGRPAGGGGDAADAPEGHASDKARGVAHPGARRPVCASGLSPGPPRAGPPPPPPPRTRITHVSSRLLPGGTLLGPQGPSGGEGGWTVWILFIHTLSHLVPRQHASRLHSPQAVCRVPACTVQILDPARALPRPNTPRCLQAVRSGCGQSRRCWCATGADGGGGRCRRTSASWPPT